jgi:hypothetical protein
VRNPVKVPHLVRAELLQQLSEALDKLGFLLARVVVGSTKLQENLIIWMEEEE